jgi:hypothetical protein
LATGTADHQWQAAVNVQLTGPQAVQAAEREKVHFPRGAVASVVEVSCANCHKTWLQSWFMPCEAAIDNTHLTGGHRETRAARKHNHDCFAYGCDTAKVVAARQQAAL